MPNLGEIVALQRRATAEISRYIEDLPGGRELSSHTVKSYRSGQFEHGWDVQVEFSDGVRTLRILINGKFPFSMPRVALVDGPPFLTWPHVEKDGMLCLHTDSTTFDIDAPVGVLQHVLSSAVDLIESCVAGAAQEDFGAEFRTY